MNLGQRAMLPSLGIFTGPDPIPNGSCTVYGYTCADPVNTSDLSGTFSTGAAVAMAIGLVFALITPGAQAFGGMAAGLFMEALARVALSSVGSFLGVFAQTWVDKSWSAAWHIAASDFGEATITGAALGFVGAVVGAGLTVLTKFEAPLAEAALEDFGYKYKLVTAATTGVDDANLYGSAAIYQAYKTMGGVRRLLVMRYKLGGEAFWSSARTPLIKNSIKIFVTKQAIVMGARTGWHEAQMRWGVFD